MVSFVFTVDDDPPHSGFSLGHLDVTGRDGEASTRGKVFPDQRMMVYLSAAQLLWDVQVHLDSARGTRAFAAIGSSIDLTFRYRGSVVDITHESSLIETTTATELAAAALASAKMLHKTGSAEVIEDFKPLHELRRAIERYEAWQLASKHL